MPEEHTITAVQPGSKRGRIVVEVDGEAVLDLPGATVKQLGLRVGQSLLPAAQEEIRRSAALQESRKAAVEALGRRAHTRADLQRKLLARGLPRQAVVETLDWLADHKYLDDEQYAQQRWETLSLRNLGAQAVFRKLVQEGVPRSVAEAVMAAQDTTLHETERVLELAEQRNVLLRKYPWPQRRQRLYGFLARRGFSTDDIAEALARLEPDELPSSLDEEA